MHYLSKTLCIFLALTFCQICRASYTLTEKDVIFTNGVIKKYIGTETDIVIPDNFNGEAVKIIGRWSFRGTGLKNVIIPSSVQTIGYSAFRGNWLTTLNIPEGVTTLEELCFCDNNLRSVNIPTTVVQIGGCSFNNNELIEVNGDSSDGLIYKRCKDGSIDLSTIVSYGGKSDCIDFIPSHVKKIDRISFIFCNLKKVIIPDGVTHIMTRAFHHNAIEDISIANSVRYIASGAFTDNKLKVFNGKPSSGFIFSLDDNGDEDLSRLSSYAGVYNEVLIIPDTVEIIESEALYGCSATKVVFPKNLKRINPYAFQASKITSIDLPEGIKHISHSAFFLCHAKSLTLPSSLVYIGSAAFNGCKISEINGEPSDGLIYARKADGTVDYKTVVSYGGGKRVIDFIPNNVETLSDFCFFNCKIKKVIIPHSIKSIGKYSFWESWAGITPYAIPPIILPSRNLDNKPIYWLSSEKEEVSEIRRYSSTYKSYPAPLYYTVKYDSNGGVDGSINFEKVAEGRRVNLVGNPTRAGYKLVGWNLASDGSGLDITKSFAIRASGTLYAMWVSTSDEESSVVAGVNNNLPNMNGELATFNSKLNNSSHNLHRVKGIPDSKFTIELGLNLVHIPKNMLALWDNYDFVNNEFWIYLEGDPIAGTAKFEQLKDGELPLPGEGLWIVNTQGEKQQYKIDSNKLLSTISPKIKLIDGWNIIGVEKQLPLKWNKSELWEWDATIQDYKIVKNGEKLIPNKGYWVYLKTAGYVLEEDSSGDFYIIH